MGAERVPLLHCKPSLEFLKAGVNRCNRLERFYDPLSGGPSKFKEQHERNADRFHRHLH